MARPKDPLLSPAGIAEAALSLIDREGLDGLNMRVLARELGVKDPSIYHHFASKEEVLVAVSRRIISQVPLPRLREPWTEFLVQAMVNYRRVMLQHPNAVQVIVRYQPSVFAPKILEGAVATLEQQGVHPNVVLAVLDASDSFVVGWVLQETALARTTAPGAYRETLRHAAGADAWNDDHRFLRAATALIAGLAAADRADAADAARSSERSTS